MNEIELSNEELLAVADEAREWSVREGGDVEHPALDCLPLTAWSWAQAVIAERLRARAAATSAPWPVGVFSEGGHVYRPAAGEDIATTAATMSAKADEIAGNVRGLFNGTPITALPGETAQVVRWRWESERAEIQRVAGLLEPQP